MTKAMTRVSIKSLIKALIETMRQSLVQIETVFRLGLVLLISLFFTACGSKNTSGLTIKIAPSQNYMLPAAISSCGDASSYKVALQTTASTVPPIESTSVSEYSISIPEFALAWSNTETLTVIDIRFEIDSPNVGGKFSYDVTGTELAALLGRYNSTFNGKNDLLSTLSGVGTIYSNDPARDCNTNGKNMVSGSTCTYSASTSSLLSTSYTACGLAVGGITLASNVNKSANFTVPFTITLVGYSTDTNLVSTPVQTQTTGTAQFIGIE